VRVQREQSFLQICAADGKVTGPETGDLEVPNRRPFQGQGKGGSRFVFDGDFDAFDLERSCGILCVKFELAAQLSRSQCRAWVFEPQKRRDWNFEPGRNTDGLFAGRPLERLERRGERRTDARSSVAIAQTAHVEVGCGNKILHAKAAPYEIAFVEFDRQLTERQFKLTAHRYGVRAFV
jgi:hypothetical protein